MDWAYITKIYRQGIKNKINVYKFINSQIFNLFSQGCQNNEGHIHTYNFKIADLRVQILFLNIGKLHF